ncbi:MAG: hypothetical protein EPN94_11525 [Nitrospirae bacterium]|nr:MAG: hypothetical protein EPN94_11525 [Nitrospirota bacterium]
MKKSAISHQPSALSKTQNSLNTRSYTLHATRYTLIFLALILVGFTFFIEPAEVFAAKMGDYCIVPSYVKTDIDPNIMIIMDNASGMTGRAYSGTYAAGTTYEGYFSPTLYYTYASNRWEPDCGTPGITADCVVGATADPNADAAKGLYYGNVLNWALTSKYDLLQKILVGGISTSRTSNVNTLVSKSGSWTAILKYDKGDGNGTRECKFEVSNANVIIRDGDTYTCGYLDTTPRPYEPGNTIVASLGVDKDTAPNARFQERQGRSLTARFLKPLAEKTLSLVSYVMGFFAGDAEAAKPLALAGGSGTLTSGTNGVAYTVTITASGGTEAGYTWSITAGSLPPGLTIASPSTPSTTISGTPTTAGTSTFTVKVIDSDGDVANHRDSKEYSITIAAAAARGAGAPAGSTQSENRNVKVCVGGSYTINCKTAGYDAGTNSLKSGIIDEFWTQARFGLMDFNAQAGTASPNISKCIVNSTEADRGTTPSPTFLTAIENAVPIDPVTPLVDAIWVAVDYFATDNSLSCDPYVNAQACIKNFILVISDGTGSNQLNIANPSDHTGGNCGGGNNTYIDATNCGSTNYANLTKNSCFGYQNDLRNLATCGVDNKAGKQNVSTYAVNTMGTAIVAGYNADNAPSNNGERLNQAASKGGGNYYGVDDASQLKQRLKDAFSDMIKRAAAGTAASVLASGEGSGANLIQAVFYPARKFYNSATSSYDEIKWTGRLTNLWYYVDPFFSTSTIRADDGNKVLDLVADDTANHKDYIVQLFYDSVNETTKAHRWTDTTGDGIVNTQLADVEFEQLGNLWEAGLELWKRDVTVAATKRKIYTTITGTSLLAGNFSQDALNGDTDNAETLRPYFGFTTANVDPNDGWIDDDLNHGGAIGEIDGRTLIRYVHGEDVYTWLRSRTVKVETYDTTARVWKLGDILNSTPKISSWLPLNSYNKVYKDTTYGEESDPSLNDDPVSTHYITTTGYKNRNMVFAGANDGMLHAFKLGTLGLKWASQAGTKKQATLGKHCETTTYRPCEIGGAGGDCPGTEACITDSDLGKEVWAFIPKNALPYLKYLAYKDYCHTFSIDMTPYIFDASIKVDPAATGNGAGIYADCTVDTISDYWKCKKSANSWRTILIGGMRYGGACKYSTGACTKDLNADGVVTNDVKDCVKSPVSDNGLSSYFALDITDQNNPTLLWEFSNADLGFTTTGPAIVRINARKGDPPASPTTSIVDNGTNGRWFVVFASGPTGPLNTDTNAQQFLGRSDQHLKLFVLDLKTGSLVRTIDATQQYIDAGATGTADLENAFAGSLLNAAHDMDQDYQDDILYIPYVKAETSPNSPIDTTTRWTQGGVLRLITNEDLSGTDLTGSGTGTTALNPAKWVLSKVIDDIGPVTSSVVRLQNQKTNNLWLYFGAGRYFYEVGGTIDDPDTQRSIYGVIEPCFSGGTSFNSVCTDASVANDLTRTVAGLSDQTTETVATITTGWKIDLDATGVPAGYKAERVITDPLATSTGVVFFTTYKPYSDECSLGGKSFIWAVKYDTGGAAGTLLKGKAMIQVSTGSIEQMDLASAFTEKGGRRTSAIEGVPPTAQGLSLVSTPPALKRVLHIRQR